MATPAEETARRIAPLYLALAGAAVVLAVAVAVVWVFMLETAEEELPPNAFPPAPVTTTPEPTPVPADPTEVFEIFEGRDPFRPLLFESPETPPPPDGPLPPGATPLPPGVTPAPPGVAPPPPDPAPATPRPGVQVELMDVAEDGQSATVRVGSQVHRDARPGQTLSDGVQLVSIQNRCAQFRRGGDSFRLCVGEFALK